MLFVWLLSCFVVLGVLLITVGPACMLALFWRFVDVLLQLCDFGWVWFDGYLF